MNRQGQDRLTKVQFCSDIPWAIGMKTLQTNFMWGLAVVLWGGLMAAGYVWLLRYSFAAGQGAPAADTMPAAFDSPSTRGRPQLVLALHPHCPCSRATLKELAKILTLAPHASDVTVLMYAPSNEPDSWSEGPQLKECRRMNYRIHTDPDGRLAASLGTLTSGAVLLYDGRGRLQYQGGITASRGHEGDNAGAQAIVDILNGRSGSSATLPVFGCPIQQGPAPRSSP
jgi:hypothetical protein